MACACLAASIATALERPAANLLPRIVNGVPTSAYPTVAALLSSGVPDGAYVVCSGTLVGCRTVLTAGHCVDRMLDPADWTVFLQHVGFLPVAAVDRHPAYAFPAADVAVLTLAAPVIGIRPSALDLQPARPNGVPGTIAGFGRTGGIHQDYGLKRLGAVSLEACSGGISDVTSICWLFETPIGPAGEDSNTCNGDSGGPLFLADSGAATVAGVTSGGASVTCLAPDASFDARVATYADWLRSIAGDDLDQQGCGASPQVGDPDVLVTSFAGTVDAAAPEGRHRLVVPVGGSSLQVTMNAVDDGSDFDLYVKRGAPPTVTDFDCRQDGSGQFGHCAFADPPGGTWQILVQRFSGSGDYQVTATLFGATAFCAPPESDGLACDDGDACTAGETCTAGVCTGGWAISCDDGVACTADACDPGIGCIHTPDHGACDPCSTCDAVAGCMVGPRDGCAAPVAPFSAKLKLKRGSTPAANLLQWKFAKGERTLPDAFGDPVAGDGLSLCMYDESGGAPGLTLRADAPGGGTCAGLPCWTALGSSGFRYRDRDRTPDGLLKLQVKAGEAGRTKASVKGKGENLPVLPQLPLALPARVQLHAAGGACWEAVYDPAGVLLNDATTFTGKSE